jgi:hypothetical protein
VDNWSTDGSYEVAQRYVDTGRVVVERFPSEPSPTYDWTNLLLRVQEVAAQTQADWVIHPVDDGFRNGDDPERYFRYFEWAPAYDARLQIKGWSSGGQPVDLAASGGHEARFPGRRVFPYRFLLKHYPIRSQQQAERKIFRDRVPRWNAAERKSGWHVQYDGLRQGQSFRWSPDALTEFDDRTLEDELTKLIGGADIGLIEGPAWATGSPFLWRLYVALNASRTYRVLRDTGLRRLVRRLFRRGS